MFSPESVYAAWSSDERAAADRIENLHNSGQRSRAAERVGTDGVRVLPDASLRDLAETYRRQVGDVERGYLTGGAKRVRALRAKLTDIEREQDHRSALAESWLATDDGTDSLAAYAARGGLAAVRDFEAPPPSYRLAVTLDRRNWLLDLPHVLAWEEPVGMARALGDPGDTAGGEWEDPTPIPGWVTAVENALSGACATGRGERIDR